MEWIPLLSQEQLDQIIQESYLQPLVIFKHSTRCHISHMAKARLEMNALPPDSPYFYYLDILNNRQLSNQIAERFQESHESPQILLISKGECVYAMSHTGINLPELLEQSDLIN